MKYLLLFVLSAQLLPAQTRRNVGMDQSLDFIYGQKILSHPSFNGAFNDLNHFNLATPITYVGLGTTGDLVITRGSLNHPGNIYFAMIVPQALQVNDSTRGKITGFNLGFTVYGFDLFPYSRRLDVLVNLGVNAGRLRLRGNSLISQKNPYLSPKLQITPRYSIGKINLQLVLAYEVDVLSKNWRRISSSHSPKVNLPQTSGTGFSALFSIGILLPEPDAKPDMDDGDVEEE